MDAVEQVKLLKLTKEDYELLIDALEHLPKVKQVNPIQDLLVMVSTADQMTPEAIQRAIATKGNDRKKEQAELLENVRILQGKILTLRRYMQEQKLVSDAYEAMNLPNQKP